MASLGVCDGACAGVDRRGKESAGCTAEPSEEWYAAGHAIVGDIVRVGATGEDVGPWDAGLLGSSDGVVEVAEAAFSWITRGVVRCRGHLVEAKEDAQLRDCFAREVGALVGE